MLPPDARQNGGMASRTPSTSHPDSFGARSTLSVSGRDYEIFSINASALTKDHEVSRLPYSIKVILENLLRHEDSPHVAPDDIVAVAAWGANPEAHGQGAGEAAHEIALTPERVLMQDFTGVPGVVDLAAMRDALARLGGNAAQVNPLVPVAERYSPPDGTQMDAPGGSTAEWAHGITTPGFFPPRQLRRPVRPGGRGPRV